MALRADHRAANWIEARRIHDAVVNCGAGVGVEKARAAGPGDVLAAGTVAAFAIDTEILPFRFVGDSFQSRNFFLRG